MLSKRDPGPVLAMVAAVLAGILVFGYLSSARSAHRLALAREAGIGGPTVDVVIARRDIAAGSPVRRGDVLEKRAPVWVIGERAAGSLRQVVGKTVISPIYAGEPIRAERLAGDRRGPMASRLISRGKVAIAVAVDAVSGVGGGLAAGDRVDVFATYEDGPTELLYGKVLVRGVGGVYPFGGARRGTRLPGIGDVGADDDTIVLEVTPEQAKAITSASEKGKLRLALRPLGG